MKNKELWGSIRKECRLISEDPYSCDKCGLFPGDVLPGPVSRDRDCKIENCIPYLFAVKIAKFYKNEVETTRTVTEGADVT